MGDLPLYRDELYPKILSQSLFDMFSSGTLYDVVLVCDGEIFAHRIILAAGSPYFRGMFSLGLKESKEERVEIKCMDGIILRKIVEYIYTGEINMSEEFILPLLEASSLLQLGSLRSACIQNLLRTIGPYSTLESCGRLANRLGLVEIETLAHRLTIEKFHDVAFGTNKMLWLEASYEVIRPLLDHPAIKSQPPNIIFKAIIEWILHGPSASRDVYIEDLISGLIHLNECVLDEEIKVILRSKPSLSKKFCSLLELEGKDYKNVAFEKEPQVVLAIGGFSEQTALKTVECYLADSATSTAWTLYLPEIPGLLPSYGDVSKSGVKDRVIPAMKYSRAYSASAFSDYEVFVVGGERYNLPTNNEASMECYSIASNTWSLKPGIPLMKAFSENYEIDAENPSYLRLVGSAAALVEGDLYVCGGRIELVKQHEKEIVGTPSKWISASGLSKATWVYNKERNKWRRCRDMLQSRAHHGAAAISGVLYALGGIGSDDSLFAVCLNTVERYDPWDGVWRSVNPMPSPRAYFGCVTAMQHIFVMGGHSLESCRDTVFKYDSTKNTWCFIEYPLPSPIDSLAAGSLKYPSNLVKNSPFYSYLIGGRNSYNGLRLVNVYNCVTHRWHCLQSMIQERVGASVAVLRLPSSITSAGN